MARISGVWAPLITPMLERRIDLPSYRRLIEHLLAKGVSGFFPLGTTGEAPTLDEDEADAIVAETVEVVAGRVPVFVGIGGNATHKVIKTIKRLEKFDFPGIVSVCPYYNRPTQDGLRQHFTAIAEATDRQILIYNIPYRTSVNLANETLLALGQQPNIVGVKDSSGSIAQSLDLLATRPPGFSVLTGEDALFYTMLGSGADGGILAACHLATERYLEVFRLFAPTTSGCRHGMGTSGTVHPKTVPGGQSDCAQILLCDGTDRIPGAAAADLLMLEDAGCRAKLGEAGSGVGVMMRRLPRRIWSLPAMPAAVFAVSYYS